MIKIINNTRGEIVEFEPTYRRDVATVIHDYCWEGDDLTVVQN